MTLNARPPVGVGVGAEPYVDAEGFIAWLERPADFAEQFANGTPYVKVMGADGLPTWLIGSASTIASGWGNNWGNDWGGPP